VPAATRVLRGAEPLLEATHPFFTQLNPILAYLSYSQSQISQFFALGASALGGAAEGTSGTGGYQGHGAGEHFLPQIAVIDSRSVQRRTTRPPYERANAYVAPNAYLRAIGLGVIESFDCSPAGGEKRNGSGAGNLASPPCFVQPAQLFQHEKFPRLRAGQVTFTPAPKGRAGTRPATP
jgi:hypothetical protein